MHRKVVLLNHNVKEDLNEDSEKCTVIAKVLGYLHITPTYTKKLLVHMIVLLLMPEEVWISVSRVMV